MHKITSKQRGDTLVEILVAIGIFTLVSGALYGLFSSGIKLARDTQDRITALALANQHVEIIKNLPYEDIGTMGGHPVGAIERTQSAEVNNIPFTIDTDIDLIDDAYDDLAPIDTLNGDYKKVEINITWPNQVGNPVTLITNIVPDGLESESGGGTLWIEVYDPTTDPIEPVADANVSIEAPSTIPPVSEAVLTDEAGRYILAGVPEGIQAYQVIVTKAGYSTAQTYDQDILTNPNPDPGHLNVIEGDVTTEYFQISELVDNLTIRMQEDSSKVTICHNTDSGSETIRVNISALETHLTSHGDVLGICGGSYDATGDPVNTTFLMHGAKTIGSDGEGLPIYKYNEEHDTGLIGEYSADNIETDIYDIIYDEETEGYVITGYSEPIPYVALPNTSQVITFDLANYEPFTELITVLDPDTSRILDADVRLHYDGAPSFDQTITSYQYGQVFFASLSPQEYSLEITAPGYDAYSNTLTINGNERQNVTLTPTI